MTSRHLSFVRNFWTLRKKSFGQYKIAEPGSVSPQKVVPDHIRKPSYFNTGKPTEFMHKPEIKDADQIAKMRQSCRLAANILRDVEKYLRVGLTTDEIDRFVHDATISQDAYPSPLNYNFFPKSVCTSVNNVACHGIPDDRPLEDGDIINVDITVYLNGYHGDCSKTFLVGSVDELGRDLVKATEICLNEAIEICKPGRKFNEIGACIEWRAQCSDFTVLPMFIGHGIGHYFHGPPDIIHTRNQYPGTMEPGMAFTIEPILTQGCKEVAILEDDWTAVTLDCARTAQFEHTVLITETGVDILTLPDKTQ